MAKEVTNIEEAKKNERVQPIILEIPERNEVWTLEFDRDSVRFAEGRGFVVEDVSKFIMTGLEDIFWYAFRMHHMRVSREQAMRILYDDLKGFPEGMVDRLAQLYNVPMQTLTQSEEDAKNCKVTVRM